MNVRRLNLISWWRLSAICIVTGALTAGALTNDFTRGQAAYGIGDYRGAAERFSLVVSNAPSAGAYQNLGNAAWQAGRVAEALLAWERATWIEPRQVAARNNLQFAREIAQLEAPDLTWVEIASTWLSGDWWAVIACGSFWFAIGLAVMPSVLRWRKAGWQQALMAIGFGIFLLSLPANYGAWTRTSVGLVLEAETPLRLTPTAEGEVATKLAAGEPARVLRASGKYLLIRTRLTTGWIEQGRFGFICPKQ